MGLGLGLGVGSLVGPALGSDVGSFVGVGATVGLAVGAAVGGLVDITPPNIHTTNIKSKHTEKFRMARLNKVISFLVAVTHNECQPVGLSARST